VTRVLCRSLLLACLALAGCLRAATAECDNGSVCPAGFRCAGPDVGRRCILTSCGNDRIDPGEVCDDGNNVSDDGCPADCSAPCGDGHLDPGETCDDGNTAGGDGCSADCRAREVCGNGAVDPSEGCDDGNERSRDGCSSQCTIESPTWSPIDLAPAGRYQYAMVYDAARGVAVLFGGRGSNNELFNDTWEWNGVTWRPRDPSTVPPGRAQHTMAYDAGRRRIVMFGGEGPGDNSTWEFDGIDWIERQPAVSPPPLVNASMVYDAGRRQIVLFGGRSRNAAGDSRDTDRTWVWDGARWQAIFTESKPPGRSQHAMAYDGKRGRVVLFGGTDGPYALNDTWTFDGTLWTLQSIISPPRARGAHTMAFDSARGTVMMFGGAAPSMSAMFNDTWEWDGSTWTQHTAAPAPSPRDATAMIYDIARDKLVLFSGEQFVDRVFLNLPTDTWEWSGGTWVKHAVGSPAPAPQEGHGMAYVPARNKIVLFGGYPTSFANGQLGETWDWDGMNWEPEVHVVAPTAPSLRSKFAMTTVETVLYMFGGASVGIAGMNDTWSLGDQWDLRCCAPQTASPRRLSAMAYDARHSEVVLFGGVAVSTNPLSDTLVRHVSSADWIRITPAHSPPARFGHSMAYDSKRGRVLLFGGQESLLGGTFNDTWEWDGADWTRLTPTTAPPPRSEHAMVYDSARERLVMFGGDAGLTRLSDTWEWDGADWHLQVSATVPPARRAHAMAYDPVRSRTLMFGGDEGESEIAPNLLNDAWEWDGVDWHRVAFSTTPSSRTGHAMVYDDRRGATLMFGGQGLTVMPFTSRPHVLSDTWVWSGGSWQQQHPAVSPPRRVQHAMAFDSARGRVVLFGGSVYGSDHVLGDDTWEWSGSTWLARTPDTRPPARRGHAMVYDAARGKTLMFGGDSFGLSADHWEWDGTDWKEVIPPLLPPIRSSFAMAYDADRQKVVLFGGGDGSRALADVWEWDGTTWSDRTPVAGPAPKPRTNHTLVYSTARRRVLLFGGLLFNDLWEWDGMAWTQLLPTDSPLPRQGHAMVWDAARSELVLFGGDRGTVNGVLGDTWLFQFEFAPPAEACRTGLDGDNDDKIGCADPDCSGLCVRCGDQVCDPLESCRLCPEDCGACNVCGDMVCDPTEHCTSCPGDCGTCQSVALPR
jgi:cysteine-rich repeat protein